MTEQTLTDLLADAAGRIEPGPAPVARVLAETGRRRRRRKAAEAGVAMLATAAAVAGIAVAFSARTAPATLQEPASGRTSPGPAPSTSVSIPPRPARFTMRRVRRVGSAQDFRAYTGPTPPPISRAEALSRVKDPGAYSLGLWDVGMVDENPDVPVKWHSVWVIAGVSFDPDLDTMAIGPRVAHSSPLPARPGWVRWVTMIDATTGRPFLGYDF